MYKYPHAYIYIIYIYISCTLLDLQVAKLHSLELASIYTCLKNVLKVIHDVNIITASLQIVQIELLNRA